MQYAELGRLVSNDKISYVGSSNFAAWNIAQACESAATRKMVGLVSEQSVYNLAKRHVELEVVPACRAYGVGLICWSRLAGGLLPGALEIELTEEVLENVERIFPGLGGEAPMAYAW